MALVRGKLGLVMAACVAGCLLAWIAGTQRADAAGAPVHHAAAAELRHATLHDDVAVPAQPAVRHLTRLQLQNRTRADAGSCAPASIAGSFVGAGGLPVSPSRHLPRVALLRELRTVILLC